MKQTEQQAIERARRIIDVCGGFDAVAAICERSKTRVHSWTYGKDKHGSGGIIPVQCQWLLLEHARANGLGLSADDFFPAQGAPDPTEDAAA